MTLLTSWKLDPYTVMRLNSGRRGDEVLKGGHLACSSHKPLTSSYSPVTKRFQAGLYHYLRLLFFHRQIQHSFFFYPLPKAGSRLKCKGFCCTRVFIWGPFSLCQTKQSATSGIIKGKMERTVGLKQSFQWNQSDLFAFQPKS